MSHKQKPPPPRALPHYERIAENLYPLLVQKFAVTRPTKAEAMSLANCALLYAKGFVAAVEDTRALEVDQ